MISKRRQKDLIALQNKKFRIEQKLFLAEGEKIVDELLKSEFSIHSIIAIPEWIDTHKSVTEKTADLIEIDPVDLKKISSLKTPNKVIAVVKIPEQNLSLLQLKEKLVMVLDEIRIRKSWYNRQVMRLVRNK